MCISPCFGNFSILLLFHCDLLSLLCPGLLSHPEECKLHVIRHVRVATGTTNEPLCILFGSSKGNWLARITRIFSYVCHMAIVMV